MADGVYVIKQLSTGRLYVGSSVNVSRREYQHFLTLRNGTHFNKFLQRAFDKYGESDFEFILLGRNETIELLDDEQFWIDKLRPEFNILPTAGSPKGYVFTEEHRKNISIAARNRKIKPHPPIPSLETRAAISAANTKTVCNNCGGPRTMLTRKRGRQKTVCVTCDRKYQREWHFNKRHGVAA
jgi:group I intron endonuclease